MTTSPVPPAPDSNLTHQPREPLIKVRILWKWSLAFVLVLMVWGMWQCGSAFRMGARLVDPAVRQFHQRLDAEQYDAICSEADEAFCRSGPNNDAVPFLKGVHEKLGNTGAATRSQTRVNAGTDGTFVTVEYDTIYAGGPAVETFTWIKRGSTLKLYRYNIQSKALLLR